MDDETDKMGRSARIRQISSCHGKVLVNDSLRWAWRNGASVAQVNTQVTNERAVALYERCGFSFAPHRLLVLHHDFERSETNLSPDPPIYT